MHKEIIEDSSKKQRITSVPITQKNEPANHKSLRLGSNDMSFHTIEEENEKSKSIDTSQFDSSLLLTVHSSRKLKIKSFKSDNHEPLV